MRKKPDVSRMQLTKCVLLFAVVAGLFIVGINATITAQPNRTKSQEDYFLDPFSLTTMAMEGAGLVRSTTPIMTLRQWIRIPYRPPVRSPFLPGI